MAVGRFQVMATLQAARLFALGKSVETAKSFGLNRAIFYAAAKKGFKFERHAKAPPDFVVGKKRVSEELLEEIRESFHVEEVGDELAYAVTLGGKTYYTIGGEIQTEKDFEKQIENRFKGKFGIAWNEALKIVSSHDRAILLSQRYFYEVVYKPRRDELAKRWSEIVAED